MKNASSQPLLGSAIALAIAGMVGCANQSDATAEAATVAAAAASSTQVEMAHCYGANTCKGHNDCKTADHACAGQGSCKGQGSFIAMPVKACADVGGKVKDVWRGEVSSADLVHCYGVNICKGHNDCKTANHACAGQGSCKGQGSFVATTKKSCADMGGTEGA